MRLSRLILSIFAAIVGFGLYSLVVYSIYTKSNDLTSIYTNTAPEQFAWSTDSTNFVFLGSTAQRGVQIADPNWYSYDVVTAMLNSSSTWPLQPVLTSAEIAGFGPFVVGNTTFMFVSPNGRYIVYTMQDTQALALGDRLLEQSYQIPNVSIPSPTIGTDQFRVLWSADSTAFTVVFASAYSDEFGTLYVRGFADNPVTIEVIPIGATLIDGRAFRFLKAHDISADGSFVLLSGTEVFPNTDLPPSRPMPILWNPSSPEDGEIFDVLTGEIKGASFESDENKLLIVNEEGLVRFNRITGEIAILNSGIGTGWVSQALFSPDGEHAAIIHEDLSAGKKTIYIICIAEVIIPTEIPQESNTPSSTNTPTATLTPTPSQVCNFSVAAGDALGLVNAINAANNNGTSADTICLEDGTYTFASASNSIALPSITTPITIVGNGAIIERGSGAPNFRLFNVTSSGALTLENLTIRNGNASGNNGGAILNAGSLTLDGVTLANNTARFGGGIHSSGSLIIRGSTLVTNSAVENGGAVYVNSGSLALSDTTLESSSARYGSGVYLNNGTADLTGVIARANHATEQGAGVYQRTGTLTISGGLFESNTARFGNGVYVDAGTATISDVTMRENVAVEEGAGIYNRTGTVSVADSVFEDNQARYGAAISNRRTVSVAGSVFTGNIAQESGGAVYTTRSTSGNQVQQSCFEGNTGRFGAAVFSSASGFNARDNWWGATTGPTGEMVNGNVLTDPFLTDGCPR